MTPSEPLTSDSPIYGDHDLVTQFRQRAPEKPALSGASVAVVDPDLPHGSAACGLGYPTDCTFLLGSIGKALNGLINSGLVASGTVRPRDALDRFLPLAGTEAARATLESLLTHTSDLPTTGGGHRTGLRMNWRLLRGRDPQPEGPDALLAQLRQTRTTPGTFEYPNLGGSALGRALATGGFGSVIILDRANRRGVSVSVIDGTMQADPVPTALAQLGRNSKTTSAMD